MSVSGVSADPISSLLSGLFGWVSALEPYLPWAVVTIVLLLVIFIVREQQDRHERVLKRRWLEQKRPQHYRERH